MKSLVEILKPIGIDESGLSPIDINGLSINSKNYKKKRFIYSYSWDETNGNDYIEEAIQSGVIQL